MVDNLDSQLNVTHYGLRGVTWVYGLNHRFSANPHWDNSHCIICGDEFKTDDSCGNNHEGYTSLGGQYWVCTWCYNEYKDSLGWRTHNWD